MKNLILFVLVCAFGLILAVGEAAAGWGSCSAPVGAAQVKSGWEYPMPGWAYYYRDGRLTWAYSYRTHRYYPARAWGWGVARVSMNCACDGCGCEAGECGCASCKCGACAAR